MTKTLSRTDIAELLFPLLPKLSLLPAATRVREGDVEAFREWLRDADPEAVRIVGILSGFVANLSAVVDALMNAGRMAGFSDAQITEAIRQEFLAAGLIEEEG